MELTITPNLVHVTLVRVKEHKYFINTVGHILVQTMKVDHPGHINRCHLNFYAPQSESTLYMCNSLSEEKQN